MRRLRKRLLLGLLIALAAWLTGLALSPRLVTPARDVTWYTQGQQ